jgi:ABC-type glycerol-3-phosphate transport system substrate-binding protein
MFMSASGWYVKAMKNFYPDLYENYAVGPLPTLKTGDQPVGGTVYSYGLLVPKTSKLSGEAWRFALYMSSQGQRGFDATGVWYGDKATKLSDKTAASENWSVFRQTIDKGSPLPTVVPYIQYITAVKSMIDQVILGGVEPAQAAKDAQLAVVRLLYS